MSESVSSSSGVPSKLQATGVPDAHQEGHTNSSKKNRQQPSVPAHIPFPYGVRCAIYSVVLVVALASSVFAIVTVTTSNYITVLQSFNFTWHDLPRQGSRDIFVVPLGGMPAFHGVCAGSTSNLQAALRPWLYGLPQDTCVTGTGGVTALGVLAIFVIVFALLSLVTASVMLGVLGCQRRRGRRAVAEAVQTGSVAPLVQSQGKTAEEAKLRRGLGITTLVLSCLGLVLTGASLGTAFSTANSISLAADAAMRDTSSTVTATSYTKAIESPVVWAHVANLILFLLTTVLLGVPYLSGIADRAVSITTKKAEKESAVLVGDEEMQETGVAGPSYYTQ